MSRPKKETSIMWISPAQIETNARQLFGDNWRRDLPPAFDMSYSQLHRYMTVYNGQTAPKAFAMALVALATMPAPVRKAFDLAMETNLAAADPTPVKFVPVKAEKPVKVEKPDAPTANFVFGDDEPAEVAEVVAAAAEAIAEASKPKAVKKPSLAKAATILGAMIPAAETKAQRDARKKREKRAAEKAAKIAAEAKKAKKKEAA